MDMAQKRMNDGDGGLAKHASFCTKGINWEGARIVARESKWTQRKFLEGIETIKEKNNSPVILGVGGGINLNKSDFCDFVIIRSCNFTKKSPKPKSV